MDFAEAMVNLDAGHKITGNYIKHYDLEYIMLDSDVDRSIVDNNYECFEINDSQIFSPHYTWEIYQEPEKENTEVELELPVEVTNHINKVKDLCNLSFSQVVNVMLASKLIQLGESDEQETSD